MTPNPPLLPVSEAANAIFDVIWPLQDWGGEERVCRNASLAAAEAVIASLQSPPAASQNGAGMREALEFDRGPWKADYNAIDGRTFIESADFTNDARFYLDGDFAGASEKLEYARQIAAALTHQGELQQGSVGEADT